MTERDTLKQPGERVHAARILLPTASRRPGPSGMRVCDSKDLSRSVLRSIRKDGWPSCARAGIVGPTLCGVTNPGPLAGWKHDGRRPDKSRPTRPPLGLG